jgi:glyoxylate utilization-related uncharacterized protein
VPLPHRERQIRLHIHQDAAEAFHVLEGEYQIFLEEREYACEAGAFIYIPAGIKHGFRVGAARSRKLNLSTLAAMVGYFDELSAAIKSIDADASRLDATAGRYAMEVTGPVPESYL